ncbi:MAG: hypothetical protein HY005_01660 [Candidatus Staskawiczbacteria bacterium]|nr:hypothetical protein [Candidatus Staskawiczbacteria bacterium]MBI3337315.1 hypothetical protein [Candidatus Staskawiczbacteria bacterium]
MGYINEQQNTNNIPNNSNNLNTAKKSNLIKIVILAIIMVLFLSGAYLVAAFFINLWPFTIPNPADNFKKSLLNLSNIDSASYEVYFNLQPVEKNQNIKPLSEEIGEYISDKKPMYDRDADRFRDLRLMADKINKFYSVVKRYPKNLAEAGITLKDPNGSQYEYEGVAKSGGFEEDFFITIIFETDEAAKAIHSRNNNKSTDKIISFDKDTSTSYYYFSGEPPIPGIVSFLGTANKLAGYLPAGAKIDFKIFGEGKGQEKKLPNGKFGFDANVDFSDVTMKLQAELIKNGDDIYAKINNFPSIFSTFFGSSFDKIKGKWIKTNINDIADDFAGATIKSFSEESGAVNNQAIEQVKLFFRLAVDHNILKNFDIATLEKIDKNNVYKFEISLDKNKISSFYEDITRNFEEKFGDKSLIKFDASTAEYLRSPAFEKLFNYLNKNIKIYLFTDVKNSYPVKFEIISNIVSDTDANYLGGSSSENQFILTTGVNLKNINKQVLIDSPKDFLKFSEVQMMLSGMNESQYLFNNQTRKITFIRTAIKSYKDSTGKFPVSLEELKKTGKNKEQFMPNLPLDFYSVYDKQMFLYSLSLNGKDYSLKYEIKLPEYNKEYGPFMGTYGMIYYSKDRKSFGIKLNHINGLNTANSESISAESKALEKIDFDKDTISDGLEYYIGTDSKKYDTDKDGVSDGQELYNKSNPLGPGKFKDNGYSGSFLW